MGFHAEGLFRGELGLCPVMMITRTSSSLVEVPTRQTPPTGPVGRSGGWPAPIRCGSREPIGAEIRSRFPKCPGVSLAFGSMSLPGLPNLGGEPSTLTCCSSRRPSGPGLSRSPICCSAVASPSKFPLCPEHTIDIPTKASPFINCLFSHPVPSSLYTPFSLFLSFQTVLLPSIRLSLYIVARLLISTSTSNHPSNYYQLLPTQPLAHPVRSCDCITFI